MELYDNVKMEFAGFDCSNLEGSVSLELGPTPREVKEVLRESRSFSARPMFIQAPRGNIATIEGVVFRLDTFVPTDDFSKFYEVFQLDPASRLYLPINISVLSGAVLENVLKALGHTRGVLLNNDRLVAFNTDAIPFKDFVGSGKHLGFTNNAYFLADTSIEDLSIRLEKLFGITPKDCTEPGHKECPRLQIDQRIQDTPLNRTIRYGVTNFAYVGEQAVAYSRHLGIDPRCSVEVITDQPGNYNDGYIEMLSSVFVVLSDLPGVFYNPLGQVLAVNRKK